MTNKKLLDFLWRAASAYYADPETGHIEDPIPEEDLVLIFTIGGLIVNRPEVKEEPADEETVRLKRDLHLVSFAVRKAEKRDDKQRLIELLREKSELTAELLERSGA